MVTALKNENFSNFYQQFVLMSKTEQLVVRRNYKQYFNCFFCGTRLRVLIPVYWYQNRTGYVADFILSFFNTFGSMLTWKENRLTLSSPNRSQIFSRSLFNTLSISSTSLCWKIRHESWAYKKKIWFTAWGMSLTWIRKSKILRIEPCGTPHDILP